MTASTTTNTAAGTRDVAAAILELLGGQRFLAMTGARDLLGDPTSLTFKLPANLAKDGINHVRISLDPVDTTFAHLRPVPAKAFNKTFTMQFARLGPAPARTLHVVEEVVAVWADHLRTVFTKYTGLDTSLGLDASRVPSGGASNVATREMDAGDALAPSAPTAPASPNNTPAANEASDLPVGADPISARIVEACAMPRTYLRLRDELLARDPSLSADVVGRAFNALSDAHKVIACGVGERGATLWRAARGPAEMERTEQQIRAYVDRRIRRGLDPRWVTITWDRGLVTNVAVSGETLPQRHWKRLRKLGLVDMIWVPGSWHAGDGTGEVFVKSRWTSSPQAAKRIREPGAASAEPPTASASDATEASPVDTADEPEAAPLSIAPSVRIVKPVKGRAVIPDDARPDPPHTVVATIDGPRELPVLARYGDLAVHRAYLAKDGNAGVLSVTHEGTGLELGRFTPSTRRRALDPATLREALAFAWDVNHQPETRGALDAVARRTPRLPTPEALTAAHKKNRALRRAWEEANKRGMLGRVERYERRHERAHAATERDSTPRALSPFAAVGAAFARTSGVAPHPTSPPRSPFAAAARALASLSRAAPVEDASQFTYLPVVSGYTAWPDVGTRVIWREETRERRGKVVRHGSVTLAGHVTRVDVDPREPKDTDVWAAPDGGEERRVGIGGILVPKTEVARFAARLAPLAAYIREHGHPPPGWSPSAPANEVAPLPSVGTRMSPKQIQAAGWTRIDPRPWSKVRARWRHATGWRLEHCGHPTALRPWALYAPSGEMILTGVLNTPVPDPRLGTAWVTLGDAMRFVSDLLAGRRHLPGVSTRAASRASANTSTRRVRSPFAAAALAIGGTP
jgi:hypothetical protein